MTSIIFVTFCNKANIECTHKKDSNVFPQHLHVPYGAFFQPKSISSFLIFAQNMLWEIIRNTLLRLLMSTITNIFVKKHSKCPKILYTKVANKMAYANSADPDQTGPSGPV